MLRAIWTPAAVHHSQLFWVVNEPDRYRSMPPVQRASPLAAGGSAAPIEPSATEAARATTMASRCEDRPSLVASVMPSGCASPPILATAAPAPAPPATRSGLLRADAVVLGVVRQLDEPEGFEQGRQVHPEPPAIALAKPVPAAHRVVRGTAPRLDRALGRVLLLIGRPERHPVAVGLEHRVEVVDRAEGVLQLRRPDLADERRRVGRLVPPHLVLGGPRRGPQVPRILARPGPGRGLGHLAPRISSFHVPPTTVAHQTGRQAHAGSPA